MSRRVNASRVLTRVMDVSLYLPPIWNLSHAQTKGKDASSHVRHPLFVPVIRVLFPLDVKRPLAIIVNPLLSNLPHVGEPSLVPLVTMVFHTVQKTLVIIFPIVQGPLTAIIPLALALLTTVILGTNAALGPLPKVVVLLAKRLDIRR